MDGYSSDSDDYGALPAELEPQLEPQVEPRSCDAAIPKTDLDPEIEEHDDLIAQPVAATLTGELEGPFAANVGGGPHSKRKTLPGKVSKVLNFPQLRWRLSLAFPPAPDTACALSATLLRASTADFACLPAQTCAACDVGLNRLNSTR
eukprot:COSAG02_NODE_35314_length_470_cov_1.021563_1_plen_147_part_10